MKKASYLIIVFLSFLFLESCVEEENLKETSFSDCQTVIIDISKETRADLMLLNKDGSYAIYDSETIYGNGVVQFNTSFDNYFEDGITIIVGEDNLPKYATIGGNSIFFSNFSWNTFDCAVLNEMGEMTFYLNVLMNCFSDGILLEENQTRAGLSDDTKIKLWAATKKTLFAIAATTAVVAMAPIVAGTATVIEVAAASAALTSLVATAYNELQTSRHPENYGVEYADIDDVDQIGESVSWLSLEKGKFKFKMRSATNLGLSWVVSPILEKVEVDLYQSIGQYEERADSYFQNRDYQFQLEMDIVSCGPKSSTHIVGIETKTLWMIDDFGVDKRWCNVSKGGDGQIVIKVQDYTDSSGERICYAMIRAVNGRDDFATPVKLTIKQSGVLFELSASTLEFTQHKGNQAVNVTYNDRISSWEIVSYPDWCKASKVNEEALVVLVDDDKTLEATKIGVVTVTAYVKNGSPINRTIIVKRIPVLSWNGTSWHFEPHLNINVSGGVQYTGGLDNFNITIQDEDACVFNTTGLWQSMEKNSEGKLTFKYKHSETHSETIGNKTVTIKLNESASMNVTRIDVNHAYATLSGYGTFSGDASGSISVSGFVTGIRTDGTRAAITTDNGTLFRIKTLK